MLVVIGRLGPLSVTVSLERSHKPRKDDGPCTKFLWLENTAEIMRESLWRPLWLLNVSNLCGLLKRGVIKQNDLDELKTHCPDVKQLEPMAVPADNNAALPCTRSVLYTA